MKSIPESELFGSKMDSLRRALIAKGGVHKSKTSSWEMPDEVYRWLLMRLGKSVEAGATLLEEKAEEKAEEKNKDYDGYVVQVGGPPVKASEIKFPVPGGPPRTLKLVKPEELPPKPQSPKETGASAVAGDNKKVLKLAPSRYVRISVETHGPRSSRQLSKDVKKETSASSELGVDKMTVRTVNEREYINPQEYEAAKEKQQRLGYVLRRHGTSLGGGFILLPLSEELSFDQEREDAIAAARDFNRSTTHWKVSVSATKLQALLSDEEREAKKVTWEIQQALKELEEAIKSCDVSRITAAIEEAKANQPTLSPGFEQGALSSAIEAAKRAKTLVVREVEKKQTEIEVVRRQIDTSVITSARMVFEGLSIPEELDMSQGAAGTEVGRFTGTAVEISEEENEQSEPKVGENGNGK